MMVWACQVDGKQQIKKVIALIRSVMHQIGTGCDITRNVAFDKSNDKRMPLQKIENEKERELAHFPSSWLDFFG